MKQVTQAQASKIDWAAARAWYMEDATRSYSMVAEKFGVAKQSVERHATEVGDDGLKTTWASRRRSMGEIANARHEEDLVARAAQRNEEHGNMWREVQEVAISQIRKYKNLGTVIPGDLDRTAKALKIGIDGERVTLSLPTNVNALTGKDGESLGTGWAELIVEAQNLLKNEDNTAAS